MQGKIQNSTADDSQQNQSHKTNSNISEHKQELDYLDSCNFSFTGPSTMVHKIIQSTEQIINGQAIQIFELNQLINQLKRNNYNLTRKYDILIGQMLGKSVSVPKIKQNQIQKQQQQNKPVYINTLLQQIVQLQDQIIKLKLELAEVKGQKLVYVLQYEQEKQWQKSQSQIIKNQHISINRPIIQQNIDRYFQKSSIVHGLNFSKLRQDIISNEQLLSRIQQDKQHGISAVLWVKTVETHYFPASRSSVNAKFRDKAWEIVKKQGIPEYLRQKVWPMIYENGLGLTTTLYTQLAKSRGKLPGHKKVVDQINKDICRSFHSRTQFDSKIGLHEEIKELLEVFHIYRPDISYVQGMTYPIIVLDLIVGKYRAFTIFTNLVIGNAFFCRLFAFEENYVSIYCRMFQHFLKDGMPQLYQRLLHQKKIHAEVYLIEWFYTFFSRALSYEATLRIWDLLAYQGQLILYKIGLAVFHELQDKLLSSQYEETITVILQFALHIECSEMKLLQKAVNYKLTTDKFQKIFDKMYKQAHGITKKA